MVLPTKDVIYLNGAIHGSLIYVQEELQSAGVFQYSASLKVPSLHVNFIGCGKYLHQQMSCLRSSE